MVSITMSVSRTVTAPVRMRVEIADHEFRIDSVSVTHWQVPRTGTLPIAVQLLSESDDTLATWSAMHDFDGGAEHWIAGQVGGPRPVGMCIGSLTAVPVGAPVSDTLFVMHGSLPSGAVC